MDALARLQARAAALSPMGVSSTAPILHDRTLYLDADGLAYYCAGNDATVLGAARIRLSEKVRGMEQAAQAKRTVLLLTGSGSHKGHRYAVARVKGYQAQRANSRRPRNWQGLRTMLESGSFGPMLCDYDREADDRFAQFGAADPEGTVIGTQDKDMRMCWGWHIGWTDNRMRYLPPGTYDSVMNDLQYGHKWFWLQMLHGDGADFIPGLPWCKVGGKLRQCGPVLASKILEGTKSNEDAARMVHMAYSTYYGERALVEMLEQAVLLWMRTCPHADWWDVARRGNPFRSFTQAPGTAWTQAFNEIEERVEQARAYAALTNQDN